MHGATLLELGGVILGLGFLGMLASRVGISPIPLYLLAGLAFGAGGILPLATSEEFIEIGAEIGVILLLLSLGLEYTASELVTNLRRQAPAGVVDLVLNFTPGFGLALLLGWGPVTAVAMGGVTYATSSGITAKLLGDLGWIGNRETPVVLSLLVLEDLAMALYLPILTVLLADVGLLDGSVTVALAVATLGVVFLIALRFGGLVERIVAARDDEVLLLKVFGLTLLVAGLAQQLRVSAAVGAFLVGITLSGTVAHTAAELLRPLRDLFAAVFFVFFGLQTDPAALPAVILPALALALVTAITKIATGYWAARRARIGPMGRARAGTALVPRGEFNIVIAGLAVAAGATPELGTTAAAYVLSLAVLGPLAARAVEPLLRWWMRRRPPVSQRSGTEPAIPRPDQDQAPDSTPTG
ncbi:cation:proton antiporter [Carbonactinospora thermoautotrophica]|uniref:Potassium transporter n=1 Tax=Carbonactinospora thermoautotrophica TaxID=1469144 RepID=A0A132MVY7_9ACTN|nr:cation:proton antiporter [Carbonactinospora thermoautotrophica]KWX00027.1 potassium transporter [Carbonactinospora thermoautotrophica]KWX02065.1 Sodium/hydrogen exchanger [Carbonactinospora thermoautotrophica]KWX09089.1 potassium transporter [Carbonactinospora thermoautotrophica]MCX9189988.1 cation:proton antiporter [Carbonactinospora thermoautotrophica]